jgi:LmbE family N-acetylglucosaminyl deacetylase
MSELKGLRLMAVLAHPDDETAGMGSTFAYYRRRGIQTSLVMATRGERGWAGPHAQDPGPQAMATTRTGELEAAASILGIDEIAFLEYIDGDLDRADPRQAISRIVAHLRRIRPQVVITFPPDGAYGHPDHIAVSQFTAAALVCAADPTYRSSDGRPHRADKFYYMIDTQDVLQAYQEVVGDLTMEVDGVVRRAVYWNDWAITTRLPTELHWQTALRALLCHRSQVAGFGELERQPEQLLRRLLTGGTFYRAYSTVNGGRALETDLFSGIA